jgi:hypothetical protein
MKPQRPNWARALLAADWEVKHFILQASLPGLTPGQIRTFKRKEREARERRRFCCKMLREEVRAACPRESCSNFGCRFDDMPLALLALTDLALLAVVGAVRSCAARSPATMPSRTVPTRFFS